MTIRRNPHRTRYVAWQDIGLFRDLTSAHPYTVAVSGQIDVDVSPNQPRFRLGLPPGFDSDRSIAFGEVYKRNRTLTLETIVYQSVVLKAGTYFVGRVDRMYQWTKDYWDSYEWLLSRNLTNTDEQVKRHI